MLEQLGDLMLKAFLLLSAPGILSRPRTSARHRGDVGVKCLADLCDRSQDGPCEFSDDMETANLMRDITKNFSNRLRIQGGSVGGNPLERQTSAVQDIFEPMEEPHDIHVGGVVIKHIVQKSLVVSVVHDRQYAEGAIVELVRGNIS